MNEIKTLTTVTLEYIGPSGAVMFDEVDRNKPIELVAGRRYQMSDALAAFRCSRDTRHWKRPAPSTRETAAAAKE